jgi:hypothetical protein
LLLVEEALKHVRCVSVAVVLLLLLLRLLLPRSKPFTAESAGVSRVLADVRSGVGARQVGRRHRGHRLLQRRVAG